jgi:hypothetical protein
MIALHGCAAKIDKDAAKSQGVMKAVMEMDKMAIAALKKAYESGNH